MTFIAHPVNEGDHFVPFCTARRKMLINGDNRIQRRRAQSVAFFREMRQGEARLPRAFANSCVAAFQRKRP
jgi:hypothetical protein